MREGAEDEVPAECEASGMSALTFVLIIVAGVLFFASIIAIYITNVTAKPGGIPRWVLGLGLATLVVGVAALATAV